MLAISRQPTTNQRHLHPRLVATVRRHLAAQTRKPVAPHNLTAFKLLMAELGSRPRPLILDSFCGTGQSTVMLADRHPEHLVVGIDKSAHRLGKHAGGATDNYLLLRAECEDLWLLLVQENIRVERHYLLYPNPWPKAKHLQRRIHGGWGFPLLLQLAGGEAGGAAPGRIELRSNWQTYVEEFGLAMQLAGNPGAIARVLPDPALTLFERKYHDSGHQLWAYTGNVACVAGAAGKHCA